MPLPWLGAFKYLIQYNCPGWGYLNIYISITALAGDVTDTRTQPFIVKDRNFMHTMQTMAMSCLCFSLSTPRGTWFLKLFIKFRRLVMLTHFMPLWLWILNILSICKVGSIRKFI